MADSRDENLPRVRFDMGHINAVVEFEAANHEDALVLAKEHFPEAHRELWQLDQFAKRLYPE